MKLATLNAIVEMWAKPGILHDAAVKLLAIEFNGAIEAQLPLQPKVGQSDSPAAVRMRAVRAERKANKANDANGVREQREQKANAFANGVQNVRPLSSSPLQSRISSSSHVFSESQTPAEEATESQDKTGKANDMANAFANVQANANNERVREQERSSGVRTSFKERTETELKRKPLKDAEMSAKARLESERLERTFGANK